MLRYVTGPVLTGLMVLLATGPAAASDFGRSVDDEWEIHDPDRPQPSVVDPGSAPEVPRPVPSDAMVLFDGSDASAWEHRNGDEVSWKIEDGYMEVVPGTGDIVTTDAFGDVQLYVEWATPETPAGDGQARANSGIFLMDRYEVQLLDSYNNPTYPDGQAAAVYGQHPPLVNASRAPGDWQSFDIIWTRPRFDDNGAPIEPARVTVFHNGVLVHHEVELTGPTAHQSRPPYEFHPDRLPIRLQDHRGEADKIRFRSIWVRNLEKH